MLQEHADASSARAALYLQSIPLHARRDAGQVYTPMPLVDFVLERAGYVPVARLEDATLLDPSCGCGVFLERAVSLLAARLTSCGTELTSPRGRKRLLDAVSRSIYGVDVDARACVLAREALRSHVALITSGPLPADAFEENIVEADFLLDPGLSQLPALTSGGFDFIVGNPPYVQVTRLDEAHKESLRASFKSARGRLDLYMLFIERALLMLREGGRLAFITPDKFRLSQSARDLRSLIQRTAVVKSVGVFRSHRVFAEAATVPCVTVLERAPDGAADHDRTEVLECTPSVGSGGTEGISVSRRWRIVSRSLSADPWHLHAPELTELERRISHTHPTLTMVASRISAGIATGRDSIYVLPAAVAVEIEEELLRPAVRGRDLSAHHICDPELYILIPYGSSEDRGPELVDLVDFPKAHAYLHEHRQALEQRHCVRVWRKAWYDLHDTPPIDLATRPKILVPDVAQGSRFALDKGRYVPLHSAYYIVPRGVDAPYLTALLNSKPLEFLIRLRAPVVKDGFSRYRKQFLASLPVPVVSAREAREIARAASDGDFIRVDELVAVTLGLGSRDMRALSEYLDEASSYAPTPSA